MLKKRSPADSDGNRGQAGQARKIPYPVFPLQLCEDRNRIKLTHITLARVIEKIII